MAEGVRLAGSGGRRVARSVADSLGCARDKRSRAGPSSCRRAGIDAALSRGIAPHSHASERWKARGEPLPDPGAQVLEAWLVQAFDFVEHAVVQRAAKLGACFFELGKVDDETGARVGLAAHRDLDLERVAVHPVILMAGGKMREVMRRVEAETAGELHWRHGMPISLCVCRLNRQPGCARQ